MNNKEIKELNTNYEGANNKKIEGENISLKSN